jgi:hypothetical protein
MGCCTHSGRQVRIWQARNKVACCFHGSRHGGYWSRDVLMGCRRLHAGSAFGAPPAEQSCSPLLAALQEPAPFHQPNNLHTCPRIQGTKAPRLLIHRRRLLRTNERREGNCFSLGSRPDVCGGPRPRPALMPLRFLQLRSRVRA